MTGKRITAKEWMDKENQVMRILKEIGPCTARDISYKMDTWDKSNSHCVANTLVRLKAQGKVKSTYETRNDVKIWEVVE